MKKTVTPTEHRLAALACLPIGLAVALSACGGGNGSPADTPSAATVLQIDAEALSAEFPAEAASRSAYPTFHAAPLLLDAPDDIDALDPAASARLQPRAQALPADAENLSSRRLTAQAIVSSKRARAQRATPDGADGTITPLAESTAISTYTPAQIRAAYGLPPLPAAGAAISAAAAARLGAGQTIYIVNAQHDPNVIAELSAFNKKFGLPGCTTKPIAVNAALPLARASTTGCEIAVVYNTAAGTMTATAPAYDAGWATEIALDVQWAHATAPLARIVLIEAADASLSKLLGGIKLANAMGPGTVSMSFGADEGDYTASVDAAFTGTNMTYLAATGDAGVGVSWPSVSAKVLAVGGTRLSYGGSGNRTEVAWSSTGGGTSAYTPTPTYQTNAVPGWAATPFRTVADVAFNADPSTGQYTAVMSPGSNAVTWLSIGGTSLSTPQWAGLVAIGNAVRAQAGKPALGAAHALLYGEIAAVPGTYAAAFSDVVQGSHGPCATCGAQRGYDPLTGLGTPNVEGLLTAFVNGGAGKSAGTAPSAPVVGSAAVNGKVGTALTFAVAVTNSKAATFSLGNAPAGMVINAAGIVSWPKPVAGNHTVTVSAKDKATGLTGQGTLTVKIEAAALAPLVIAAPPISGVVGKALAGSMGITAPGATSVSFSIAGAPAGMTFSKSGMAVRVAWPKPVLGNHALNVQVTDSLGRTASATVPVTIKAK